MFVLGQICTTFLYHERYFDDNGRLRLSHFVVILVQNGEPTKV